MYKINDTTNDGIKTYKEYRKTEVCWQYKSRRFKVIYAEKFLLRNTRLTNVHYVLLVYLAYLLFITIAFQ